MTRTIRLTRLHALNWYGYKDTLPIEGNALLAGVTGSGKSALMDLIQLVLVGDQRLVRFNQPQVTAEHAQSKAIAWATPSRRKAVSRFTCGKVPSLTSPWNLPGPGTCGWRHGG